MWFKRISGLFIIFLFSPSIYALENVSVQFHWLDQFEFAGFYIAKEKGFYEKEGLAVELKNYQYGMNVVDEVLSGNSTFAVGGSDLIIEVNRKKPLMMLFATFQSSPLILISTKQSGIQSVKNFSGKRLMITPDATSSVTFKAMMEKEGVHMSDMVIQKHSFDVNDLINNKTDLMQSYISNEPYALYQRGIEPVIFDPKKYGFDLYSDIIFTSVDVVSKRYQTVNNFKEATLKGWQYAFEHIEETVDIVFDKYNSQHKSKDALLYEANALKKLAYTEDYPFGYIDIAKIQRMHDAYNILNLVENKVDLKKHILVTGFQLTKAQKQYILKIVLSIIAFFSLIFLISLFWYRKLQKQDKLKENVFEGAQLGYWDWYPQTKRYYVSQKWLAILGLKKSDIKSVESDWYSRIHPDDLTKVMTQIETSIQRYKKFTLSYRIQHKEGHYIWVDCSGGIVEEDRRGQSIRLSGTHRDITKAHALEEQYEKQRIRMQAFYDFNPNIILIKDQTGLIDANQAFFKLFKEYKNIDEFKQVHTSISDFFEDMQDETYLTSMNKNWVIEVTQHKNRQVLIKYKGEIYNFDVIGRKITFGDLYQYIITFNDTTERYRLGQELQQKAIIDDLTGLYNRRHFNKSLDSMHADASRFKSTLGFIMADIDNFKRFNDNYGHDQGDVALKKVAQLIKGCFSRQNDVVCRLGGEEFGIIVLGMNASEITALAQRACDAVYQAGLEHQYNNEIGVMSISIGVALHDFSQIYRPSEALYKEADLALYQSKNRGRNCVTLYLDMTENLNTE
jgi:polar amino acid transport system substrate-binding protein